MSTSRRRCLSAWGHSRHAPSFGAPVINRRRRANGHPRVFSGARDVPRHARGRPFPQRCRHRPVVSHDLPGLLGTAPRGVVSPQRHPHQGQATIHRISGLNDVRMWSTSMRCVSVNTRAKSFLVPPCIPVHDVYVSERVVRRLAPLKKRNLPNPTAGADAPHTHGSAQMQRRLCSWAELLRISCPCLRGGDALRPATG